MIEIGQIVRREPEDRFTAGQRGKVVAVKAGKAQVLWWTYKPRRTWVDLSRLKVIAAGGFRSESREL